MVSLYSPGTSRVPTITDNAQRAEPLGSRHSAPAARQD